MRYVVTPSVVGGAEALVYVPEAVELRADAGLDLLEQVEAAGALVRGAEVAVAERRAVREDDVGGLGDEAPLLAALGAALRY